VFTNKCMIAAMLVCFGSASAHAADRTALPKAGHFYGYGTVASIGSKAGGACPVALGDKFNGVLQLPGVSGKGSIFRVPLTLPSGMVVQEDVFPETFEANVPSTGYYQFGIIGTGPLTTGQYEADFGPLDEESFGGQLTLIYPNPIGAPGDICTERDWLVFIRTGGPAGD
jgi:hypothetical protein